MHTVSAATHPLPQIDRDEQDALFFRDVLHELIEIGRDHARDVHRESQTRPQPTHPRAKTLTAIDYANAHERLSRGIRRDILLARKLAEPIAARRTAAERRDSDRREIIRAVEDKIHRHAGAYESGALQAEFYERLDSLDREIEIDRRPIADVIIQICRDLGLENTPATAPWKRRTPRDLAILNARAARPNPAPPIPQHRTSTGPAPCQARTPPANSA